MNDTIDAYEGPQRHFTDPLRGRMPELERCMIRHRALEMILILHHAEELKRDVIQGVTAQKSVRAAILGSPEMPDEAAEEAREGKKQKKAFDYLVRDGVLTAEERTHMVTLIGRRNDIAHHLDQVTADLSIDSFVRNWLKVMPDRKIHDYEVLKELRTSRRLLSERMATKGYILKVDMRSLLFSATERALSADLSALERRIRRLVCQRRDDITAVNGELSLEGTELKGTLHPGWPDNRDGRGCLTPKGVETCYRLFDMGKSTMAIAHLMGLSLAASRRRERMWKALGGLNRERREFAEIPAVRIRHRFDD